MRIQNVIFDSGTLRAQGTLRHLYMLFNGGSKFPRQLSKLYFSLR